MPAKNLSRINEDGIYLHIYNKGVENRAIFNDREDYRVFLGYLKDYLTAPKNPDSIKRDFKVHDRTFQGIPHQPKNYLDKVELIAYSLMPDHFHLLLHQVTKGSVEGFIRSLCTRYSMYFNKKYQRTGALFAGPYKSVQIKDEPRLLYLTRYLHHTGNDSSYAEYLGARETSWVKPKGVTSDYKDFVEKYKLDEKEKELLEGITFESKTQHLERRDLGRNVENYPPGTAESSEKIHSDQNLKPLQRIPEFLATTVVFLLLLAFGIRNIMTSTIKSPNPSPSPAVLSKTVELKEIKPKIILTIKINDGVEFVNIRQKPTTNSNKIGKAKDGDTFDFVFEDSGWYGVKLPDSSTGYISAKYIEKGETNN